MFASLSHTHYWYEGGMLKVLTVHAIDVFQYCCMFNCFVVSGYGCTCPAVRSSTNESY